jgi:dUTP diphosphatase
MQGIPVGINVEGQRVAVLAGNDIRRLIQSNPPLLEGYPDLDAQVQPNGFDLTLRDVAAIAGSGQMAVSNERRVLPGVTPLDYDADGFIELTPGAYKITFNEIVSLPLDLMAIARSRSSLLRCGVVVHSAVWDAGYSGRSESLMTVHNADGFRLQRDARVLQLVFMRLSSEAAGYRGVYQGENI